MCTRYVLTAPADALRDLFRVTSPMPNWPPNYNVAPTHITPIVRQAGDGRELAVAHWGLIPWFSKDGKPSFSTINARAEGVQTAASYQSKSAAAWCRRQATSNGPGRSLIDSRTTSPEPMATRWRLLASGSVGAPGRTGDEGELHHRHHCGQTVRGAVPRPDASDPGAKWPSWPAC